MDDLTKEKLLGRVKHWENHKHPHDESKLLDLTGMVMESKAILDSAMSKKVAKMPCGCGARV